MSCRREVTHGQLVILLAVLAQSELQVGYRPRTMFTTAPSAGPHVSPGISL
jgi:hypothetical protein